MNLRTPRSLLALLALLTGAVAGPSVAQTGDAGEARYRLGAGDVLQLSVWQQPDLDRQLRIREDGSIVVPLLGEVEAAGQTVPELETLLARRLRAFHRDITEVSLTVLTYNSFSVYVMGAVASPGEYTFDGVPDAWDALRAAGGPGETANLRRIKILRQQGAGTSSIVVDLGGIVSGSRPATDIPELEPGDTLIVPDLRFVGTADRQAGVHVLGEVSEPGLYALEEPAPLISIVLLAGGFGRDADLSRVRWVHQEVEGPVRSQSIDVRRFLDSGLLAANPLVGPGDTVFVEREARGLNLVGWISASTGLVAILLNVLNR